ncbi:MAG: glycosyltransferase family 9 protein [Bacteroidales bacterium]|nr:glycosyltransferase family 9 protein [Bacteroidales bacterium]
MNLNEKHIIISRTDAIGDVVLTLPLVGYLKKKFPHCKITFLGQNYTRDIVLASSAVDSFLGLEELTEKPVEILKSQSSDIIIHVFPRKEIAKAAKKAGIPIRIGTSHRLYHRVTCNKRPNFSRYKSDLHEAQLNFKLLSPLGINEIPSLEEIPSYYSFENILPLPPDLAGILAIGKKRMILHPGSKGSAREWGLDRFSELISLLPPEKFHVFLTGTEEEGLLFRKELPIEAENLTDLSGKLSLSELIGFIAGSDALVAASTGPLHIAAATGIHAIGVFPPIRPMHPGRWAPLGVKTKVFVADKECDDCRKSTECACMRSIEAKNVAEYLISV